MIGAMHRAPFRRHCAFTLVELILVIGIAGLLLGMLLPCLARARQAAAQVHCAANLRAWTWAAMQYAQDCRGYLPRRGQGWDEVVTLVRTADWFNALPPYLGQATYHDRVQRGCMPGPGELSVWVCQESVRGGGKYYFSYGMNMWLSAWFTAMPDKIDRVGPTSTMVFMADAPDSHCSTLPGPAGKAYNPAPRHGGRVNLAFLDGHVASFPADELGCGKGFTERSDVRWKVPDSPWPGPP